MNDIDTTFSTHYTKVAGVEVTIEKDGTVSFDVDGLRFFDVNLLELIGLTELATDIRDAHQAVEQRANKGMKPTREAAQTGYLGNINGVGADPDTY